MYHIYYGSYIISPHVSYHISSSGSYIIFHPPLRFRHTAYFQIGKSGTTTMNIIRICRACILIPVCPLPDVECQSVPFLSNVNLRVMHAHAASLVVCPYNTFCSFLYLFVFVIICLFLYSSYVLISVLLHFICFAQSCAVHASGHYKC